MIKKPNDEDRDRALRDLLREWQETPQPDAGLAVKVRRELRNGAAAEERRPARTRAGRGWSPAGLRLALACVAAGAALGIGVAEWRERSRLRDAEMAAQYLQWIQPTGATAARTGGGGSRS